MNLSDWNCLSNRQDIEILELLLQNGADPNYNNSSNLLANAIIARNEERIKLLLKYGARVDLPTGIYVFFEHQTIEQLAEQYLRSEIQNLIKEKLSNEYLPPPPQALNTIDNYHKRVAGAIPILKGTTFQYQLLETLRKKIIKNPEPEILLGLNQQSNLDDIKKAYKKIIVEVHPDKHGNSSLANEVFLCVNEAYEYLRKSAQK